MLTFASFGLLILARFGAPPEGALEQFRSASQYPLAAVALDSDSPEFTVAEEERLIRGRLLPAEHLPILPQAQFAAGRSMKVR